MQIYLKRTIEMFWGEVKEFICLSDEGSKTRYTRVELDPFADSYAINTELRCRKIDRTNREIIKATKYQESNKEQFMEAYASAKNSLHTFQLSINPK